ncbi:signal peptidase II [Paludicola sp. MB14-C6]|uniref:signal peptidase II n=1 Tax=Paludihabitans sp. MB14-C6 TaxID=3070656 RepID=UPI0027DCE8A2|nr:signal peptidase II [Paludicola sp. MB14-C6]WMJ23115.1 signal peptidase II [Paludicola sp. MB14-C6]
MKYFALSFSLLIIGLDQLFKELAIIYLSPIATHPIIEDIFHLTYVENKGAAFGIMQGKKIFLIGVTFLVIIAAIVFILMNKVKSNFFLWSLALIIGGGVGNLIDRAFRGFVVDYLDVRLINFAVFNFADCCVVVGTILVMIYLIFFEGKKGKTSVIENKIVKADSSTELGRDDNE